jgi:hypothetical protein
MLPALLNRSDIIALPDTKTHRFRFDIPSESSNNIYRISQRITNGITHGQYECNCESWLYRRGGNAQHLCKHLQIFKPALDELARAMPLMPAEPKHIASKSTKKPTKTETTEKTTSTTIDDYEVIKPESSKVTISNGSMQLNKKAQSLFSNNLVQILYSKKKNVIILKPSSSTDDFSIYRGIIDAQDFLSDLKINKDFALNTMELNGETVYSINL